MYSDTIVIKINALFSDLFEKSCKIVDLSIDLKTINDEIYNIVSLELSSRSKSMMSDLLYMASKKYLSTMDPMDIRLQNKFLGLELTDVLLKKFEFQLPEKVIFKVNNNKRFIYDGGVALGVFTISWGFIKFVMETLVGGYIIIPTMSSLIAAVLLDHFIIKDKVEKQEIKRAISSYLLNLKEQFIHNLNCVESEFYERLDDFESSFALHEV